MRQAAEWGMGAVQRSFPRLTETFRYEEGGERARILKTIFLLFNIRTALVGQNQIRTVFFDGLDRNAEELVPLVDRTRYRRMATEVRRRGLRQYNRRKSRTVFGFN